MLQPTVAILRKEQHALEPWPSENEALESAPSCSLVFIGNISNLASCLFAEGFLHCMQLG